MEWPQGLAGPRRFHGRARDYLTPVGGGAGRTLAEASLLAMIDTERRITAITADPAPARLQELVGERGGGHLRSVLRDKLPELVEQAHPVRFLLGHVGQNLVQQVAGQIIVHHVDDKAFLR